MLTHTHNMLYSSMKGGNDMKKPICPECGCQTILTNKTGIRRCRRCGHEWKKENENKPITKNTVVN